MMIPVKNSSPDILPDDADDGEDTDDSQIVSLAHTIVGEYQCPGGET